MSGNHTGKLSKTQVRSRPRFQGGILVEITAISHPEKIRDSLSRPREVPSPSTILSAKDTGGVDPSPLTSTSRRSRFSEENSSQITFRRNSGRILSREWARFPDEG